MNRLARWWKNLKAETERSRYFDARRRAEAARASNYRPLTRPPGYDTVSEREEEEVL